MIPLTYKECKDMSVRASQKELDFDAVPLQAGLGGCPWRVGVASILLCRTRRLQMDRVLRKMLLRWPEAGDLARSDTDELLDLVRPCGLQNNRARQLQRFSTAWLADWWTTMQQLPGVGLYVADAIGLVCFECTALMTQDVALRKYAEVLRAKEPFARQT